MVDIDWEWSRSFFIAYKRLSKRERERSLTSIYRYKEKGGKKGCVATFERYYTAKYIRAEVLLDMNYENRIGMIHEHEQLDIARIIRTNYKIIIKLK